MTSYSYTKEHMENHKANTCPATRIAIKIDTEYNTGQIFRKVSQAKDQSENYSYTSHNNPDTCASLLRKIQIMSQRRSVKCGMLRQACLARMLFCKSGTSDVGLYQQSPLMADQITEHTSHIKDHKCTSTNSTCNGCLFFKLSSKVFITTCDQSKL